MATDQNMGVIVLIPAFQYFSIFFQMSSNTVK